MQPLLPPPPPCIPFIQRTILGTLEDLLQEYTNLRTDTTTQGATRGAARGATDRADTANTADTADAADTADRADTTADTAVYDTNMRHARVVAMGAERVLRSAIKQTRLRWSSLLSFDYPRLF